MFTTLKYFEDQAIEKAKGKVKDIVKTIENLNPTKRNVNFTSGYGTFDEKVDMRGSVFGTDFAVDRQALMVETLLTDRQTTRKIK